MEAPPVGQPRWRQVLPVGAAGLLLGCLLLGAQFLRLGLDPTAPFYVGSSFGLDDDLAARGIQVEVQQGPGYDGQWFLGLAYDPLLRDHLTDGFDVPRYRAGRPLQAMLGWALAAGRTAAIPVGLLAVGPLAAALGSMAMARLFVAFGRSRWWGVGFALVPGIAVGVAFATAEPLGLALAAVGVGLVLQSGSAAGSRRRTAELQAGLAFAGAALTKESYLLFAAVGALHLAGVARQAGRPSLRPALALLGLPLAALAAWWVYVLVAVPPTSRDGTSLGAVGPPLLGWGRTLRLLAGGDYPVDGPFDPVGYLLVVGSLAACLAGIVVGLRSTSLPARLGLVLGGYGLLLSASLLGHFLSSMRALAPTVLAAGLAVAAATRPRGGARPVEAELAHDPPGGRLDIPGERAVTVPPDREQEQEWLRQLSLIYSGLIAIGVVMVQPFLTAASLDQPALICVVAFSVAIPLLAAALVVVNRQEVFRRRMTRSFVVETARVVAQACAFVGVVAGFWHIHWIAGVGFLASGLVAVGVHSAGYVRLERDQQPPPRQAEEPGDTES